MGISDFFFSFLFLIPGHEKVIFFVPYGFLYSMKGVKFILIEKLFLSLSLSPLLYKF